MEKFAFGLLDESFLALRKLFDEQLLRIEERHITYFQSSPPLYPHQNHGRIFEHLFLRAKVGANGKVRTSITFMETSGELPVEVRVACVDLFNQVFHPKMSRLRSRSVHTEDALPPMA